MIYQDWETLIQIFRDKHLQKSGHHLRGLQDETLIVLKSHLLSEEILKDFCSVIVVSPEALLDARLSYKQTMLLARAFFDEQEDWVWAILGKLNRMRNLMAHTLEPATMEYEKCRNSIYSVIGDRCGKNCEDLRPKLIEIFEYVLGFLSCFCLARIEILRLTTAISVMNSPAVDMEKLRIPMPEDAK